MSERVERSSIGSLPEDCDPRLKQIHAYWESIRPSPDLLPGRQHFDPVDVPRLLSWIWLANVERDPLRFRYRLTGTEHVMAMNGDYTGRLVGEKNPDFLTTPQGTHYVAAVEQGIVGYFSGKPTVYTNLNHSWFERVLLPLARDGKTVDMLLGMTIYHRITSWFW